MASNGVIATIIIFVFVFYCIVLWNGGFFEGFEVF